MNRVRDSNKQDTRQL